MYIVNYPKGLLTTYVLHRSFQYLFDFLFWFWKFRNKINPTFILSLSLFPFPFLALALSLFLSLSPPLSLSQGHKNTMYLPLILKVLEIIFFVWGKHMMGHFLGFFERAKKSPGLSISAVY
jgi:hypothetical protein